MIGIGHQVFKGLVRVGARLHPHNMPSGDNGRHAQRTPPGGDGRRGPDATAFWDLYHQQAKSAGGPIEVAKGLAQQGDWAAACKDLRTIIAGAERWSAAQSAEPRIASVRNPRPSPCVYQGEVKTMEGFLIWLIKLPFVLVAIVLAIALGIVGCVLSILGVGLTPVFGVGLVILPIGLILLAAAWLIAKVV